MVYVIKFLYKNLKGWIRMVLVEFNLDNVFFFLCACAALSVFLRILTRKLLFSVIYPYIMVGVCSFVYAGAWSLDLKYIFLVLFSAVSAGWILLITLKPEIWPMRFLP
nr:MAG TPA_asm: hypothetical protein [Caudoviricetes sp.]